MPTAEDAARGLAVSGDPILQFSLDYLKQHGFDLPTNGIAARAWCEQQAGSGDTDAQVVCGEMYVLGLYGEESGTTARYWFQRAADQGHPAALLMLANFVESGSLDSTPDPKRALELIRTAAEKEYGPAITQLGVLYLQGIGVESNRVIALTLLRRASDLGDAQAQFLLGSSLIKEPSLSLVREGIGWIEKAATQGYAGAHRELGYLYSDGRGGFPKDEEKSRQHFFTAAQIEENASSSF